MKRATNSLRVVAGSCRRFIGPAVEGAEVKDTLKERDASDRVSRRLWAAAIRATAGD